MSEISELSSRSNSSELVITKHEARKVISRKTVAHPRLLYAFVVDFDFPSKT
jgi:hypothetical protein